MNKQALIEAISQKVGITKVQAEEVMQVFIDSVAETLRGGREVSIAGLGIFVAKLRASRMARNPRTGESVMVPEMRVPKFKPAKALKDAVK